MNVQLTTLDWAIAVVMTAFGGFVTGTGGFGFALVTTPVLLWVLPPPLIVLTNLAVSVALRVPLVWADRRHVVVGQAALIGVGGLLGLPLGLLALSRLDSRVLTICAELTVITLSVGYLIGADRLPRVADPTGIGRMLVGLSSGALNTSTSLSGPPMVLWLLSQRIGGRSFRATVSAVGLALNLVGVVLLIRSGTADVSWLLLAAVSLPAAAAGTWVGHLVLERLAPRAFARGVALFVIVSGIAGVVLVL